MKKRKKEKTENDRRPTAKRCVGKTESKNKKGEKISMKEFLKKMPWGIIAGVCGVIVFYTIAATIASSIIMDSITSIVEGAAGIFGTWWQTLLFVCDIIFGLLFIGALVMFILTKVGLFDSKEGNANASA